VITDMWGSCFSFQSINFNYISTFIMHIKVSMSGIAAIIRWKKTMRNCTPLFGSPPTRFLFSAIKN